MAGEPILALAAKGAPEFVTADGAALRSALKARFETLTGRPLSDVQVEMLLLETAAYLLSLRAIEENVALAQNFIAWASGDFLDVHGADRSMPRLEAVAASVTLRFSRDARATNAVVVPAGLRVSLGDVVFATTAALILTDIHPNAEVSAIALTPGSAGNGLGLVPAAMIDPAPGVISCEAINSSFGGADRETDDRYRARLATAFLRINRGGTAAAYKSVIMDWNAMVVDVAVASPVPGRVDLYPLMQHGLPTGDEIAAITAWMADGRTPMCVDLRVLPPQAYDLQFVLTLRLQDPAVVPAVEAAVAALMADWSTALGGFAAPSDVIVAAKSVDGVLDADVDFLPVSLARHEWLQGRCTVVVL